MYRKFYLWLSLLSAMVLLIIAVLAGYKETTPEWRSYQEEYRGLLIQSARDDSLKKDAMKVKIGLGQIYMGDLKRVDRCTNCHLGLENPLMANAKLPFKMHSGDFLKDHPPNRFGCTVCHNGQGRATNMIEAHGDGHGTHWGRPLIPFEFIQSSCAQCHDLEMLKSKGGDRVVKGERLFRERGCKGCHKLNGTGGVLGKSLDGVGSQPEAYFPMRLVEQEGTIYTWMKEHFDDPRNIVVGSEMIGDLTDEESDCLTNYVLSLRSDEIPKTYRRIAAVKPAALFENKGESLYTEYCVACHTTGKDSVYDKVFKRTIPAIMNPAFLKAADDKFIKTVISEGRANTQMTAWKYDAAGVPEEDIDEIIKYITRQRPGQNPEPFLFDNFKGDAGYGEELYKVRCMTCHGERGEGGVGLNLRNPVVQKKADPGFLAITVRDGRAGTHMAAFGKNGVGFGDQDIVDVITYVRTLSIEK